MKTSHITFRNNLRRVFLATALVCSGLNTQAAQATDPRTVNAAPAKHVQFDDLNLASHTAVERLYRRINAAANEVCGPVDRTLLSFESHRNCMQQTVSRAVQATNLPQLAALHALKTGQPIAFTKLAKQ